MFSKRVGKGGVWPYGRVMIRLFVPAFARPPVWTRLFAQACLFLAVPLSAADEGTDDADPHAISATDAISCRIGAADYMGFALSISDDEQGVAAARGWRKVAGKNPFLSEYELPAPIAVAGYTTRRIAFSGSAILAVLDLPDPVVVADREGIANELSVNPLVDAVIAGQASGKQGAPFRKFMGEKVISEETEPATSDSGWSSRTVVTRTISNVTSHPGKTLYGCNYRTELLDKDGNPL